MPKFSGKIGFGYEVEVSPGVFDLAIVERSYLGDVVREALERVGGQTVLGESKTANSFNIVGDAYSYTNFMDMKYVLWNGRYYEVRQTELKQRPRMLIRIGGRYNGPTAEDPAAQPPEIDPGI